MAEEALNATFPDFPYPFPIGEPLAEVAGLYGSHNYTASDLYDLSSDHNQRTRMCYATHGVPHRALIQHDNSTSRQILQRSDLTSDDNQRTRMCYATHGVPHRAMIQHDNSTSRQIPQRLDPSVSLSADGIEIKIRHPYPDTQVWQLDSMSSVPADMDVGSPFFMSGISYRDKRNGYFMYDSKGYPVPHDRILKAEREDPAIPPVKRKTVHTKQKNRPECEASRWYDLWVYQPSSWCRGNKREDRRKGESKPDFEYTQDAQLVYRKYTTEEIQAYLDECPREYALWIQRDLSQFKHRLQTRTGESSVKEDRYCRWKDCPAGGRPVSGMYRVAFDEFPTQTSQGIKDPFKVAMVMHLWCFERIFDPVIYHKNGRLHLDTRTFAILPSEGPDIRGLEPHPENLGRAENVNPFSIRIGNGKRSGNYQERIPEAVYFPWLERNRNPSPATHLPRIHEDSLGYAFTLWQLEKETASKLKLRRNRHGELQPPERDGRPESERFSGTNSTRHLGSLEGWKAAQESNKGKNRKKKAKSTAQCRETDTRDDEEPSDKDDAPPPQPRGKKKGERPRKRARKDKEP
ncbi:hypothetical protein E4U58_003854 [Claviceps cyperi]|nr:hypothetical protein E4U58_003854 [Claviceps cyperi]